MPGKRFTTASSWQTNGRRTTGQFHVNLCRSPISRIRLRLSAKKAAAGSTEKQPTRKRKATPQKTENGNARKKSRRSNAKASPSSSSSDEESGEEEEEDSMFDLDKLQSEQDKLDGSWDSARDFTTKCGPWRLPEEIETKFKQVAKVLLINLSK